MGVTMRDLMKLVEGHVPFDWSTASEDNLREYAAAVQGDNDDGSPAYFDPYAGTWRYDPAFPLSKLTRIMSPTKWKKWIASEVEHLVDDLGHDRGYTAMMSEEIEEPIVLSIYKGQAYVWDGFHRIGVSFAKGATTIRAVVGTLPPSTRRLTMREIMTSAEEHRSYGMPQAQRDPAKPVYLRVGVWNPDNPVSSNYALGTREKGLSVYELDADGNPVIPPVSEWAEDDLRDRLRSTENEFFLVQGRRLSRPGHDGEPLLARPVVVGLWQPPEGSLWAGIFRQG